MKRLIKNILLLLIFAQPVLAQDVITVETKTSDISDNLDLEAVASVFGDSENLEDFEKRLNDPEEQISNLDLNEDGYVDYLRVVENSEEQTILITIQAVLGKDLFQDVATIEVEKGENGQTQVQVVGDVYMYGSNYIIEPVYVRTPVVCTYFWGSHYYHYHSPYYWHYYPTYYNTWQPYPSHIYRHSVYTHVNTNHVYNHTTVRRSTTASRIHTANRRNDYARNNPNRSFSSRNTGVKNTRELDTQRGTARKATTVRSAPSNSRTARSSGSPESVNSTRRQVQSDWSGSSRSNGQGSQVKSNISTPNRTTTTRQSPSKASDSRSVQSNSSSSRSVQSKSSNSSSSGSNSIMKSTSTSSSPTQARSNSSSSSNNQSTSRSSGQKSNNKSEKSKSGSSNGRSKKR